MAVVQNKRAKRAAKKAATLATVPQPQTGIVPHPTGFNPTASASGVAQVVPAPYVGPCPFTPVPTAPSVAKGGRYAGYQQGTAGARSPAVVAARMAGGGVGAKLAAIISTQYGTGAVALSTAALAVGKATATPTLVGGVITPASVWAQALATAGGNVLAIGRGKGTTGSHLGSLVAKGGLAQTAPGVYTLA